MILKPNEIEQFTHDIGALLSESSNPKSIDLDKKSPLEIAKLMNAQDRLVALAVETQLDNIAKVIDLAAEALSQGGRIIYIGAGTSGRLGVLDAAECPPTFGVSANRVIGILAGGNEAMFASKEGCEDDPQLGAKDLLDVNVSSQDLVIGLAVSGRTPYVLGALIKANAVNAKTVAITCNENSPLEREADITIAPIVGPEILTGSTRLKSGSAQKMVLNMISTGAMVRIGKCYFNNMVDLKASNEKLKARAIKLVCDLAEVESQTAINTLEAANWQVKTSILMLKANLSAELANQLISRNGGRLATALENYQSK